MSWLVRALQTRDEAGRSWVPGANRARRWAQPDGSEVTLVAHGDAFDLYIGGPGPMYNFSLTPRTAVSLALWLVRWWIIVTWCGMKLRLWTWALSRQLERQREAAPPSRLGRSER